MGKLTIQEIARVLTEKNGLEQREANRFASEMFAIIQQRLETDQLVKVKGLGTFKMIDVEARESVSVRTGERVVIDGHAKVSFIPDNLMRELVNKPFSQFETVVLNEGVEFDDLTDNVTEEELQAEESLTVEKPAVEIPQEPEPAVEPAVEPVAEESVAEEPAPVVEEPVIEEPVAEDAVAEEPVAEDEESAAVAPLLDIPDEEEEEEAEDGHSWYFWLLTSLAVLAAIAAAGLGGYQYGKMQASLIADTVYVHDTVLVAQQEDTLAVEEKAAPEKSQPVDEPARPVAEKSQPVVEQPTVPEQKPATTAAKPEVDKYAAKDERVRLGAYRIVGLEREVKVLPGQTFYSICKAHLGSEMQCYVEVYNDLPRNPKVKEGQIIKIPKLELKKRKK